MSFLAEFSSPPPLSPEAGADAAPANFAYRFGKRAKPTYDEKALSTLAGRMTAGGGPNSSTPAGYTYLGQFLLHDISFDVTPLPDAKSSYAVSSVRTPRFDLDSMYGRGLQEEPYLQDCCNRAKMLVGRTLGGDFPNDVPRAPHGVAIIPEPRNDENLITAQLHVAWLRFHNQMVDLLAGQTKPEDLFEAARQEVIAHYQRMILDDYLPRIVHPKILKGGSHAGTVFRNGRLYIPFEFSHAAFRFGHATIRDEYVYNRFGEATFGNLMDVTGAYPCLPHVPLPEPWVIDWRRFFEFPGANVTGNPALKMSPRFASPLGSLPIPGPGVKNLAEMDLVRAFLVRICSGEDAAQALGFTALTPGELNLDPVFAGNTPLLYYVLREAELCGKGERLGPVGGQIVCDTILGLLEADPLSVVNDTLWKPKIPCHTPGLLTMADILTFADVVNPLG